MAGFDTEVLVVGAGPVGLFLAAELRRQGVSCRLVERLPEASPFCRALGVQSRTLEILGPLGLAEAARGLGVRVLAANTWQDGQLVGRATLDWGPMPEIPYPVFLNLEQNLLEGLLADHLATVGIRVERELSLVEFQQDEEGVTATLASLQGRRILRSRYLVGCDGTQSTVRRALGIPYEGAAYPETWLLADSDVEGCLAPEESHVFHRDGQVLYADPMRGARRFRFSTRDLGPRPASSTKHGLMLGEGRPPSAWDVQLAITRIAGPGVFLLRTRWTSRYRVSQRLAARYREGRVFLAGDAAHVHPPAGGQGMNMGIQDAHNLAWKLALALRGRGTPGLLDSYEAERRHVARAVLVQTDRSWRTAGAGEEADDPGAGQRLLREWSQLDLNYRGLPLFEQHGPPAGELPVQAGDRAPDGPLVEHPGGAGRRVFDLLRSTGFHLLLFACGSTRSAAWAELAARLQRAWGSELHCHFLAETGAEAPPGLSPFYADPGEAVAASYGVREDAVVLIRPDGYIGFRSDEGHADRVVGYLEGLLGGGNS